MPVNITAYPFRSLRPSLTVNGAKHAIPQLVKGGVISTLSVEDQQSSVLWLAVFDICILHILRSGTILQQIDLQSIVH